MPLAKVVRHAISGLYLQFHNDLNSVRAPIRQKSYFHQFLKAFFPKMLFFICLDIMLGFGTLIDPASIPSQSSQWLPESKSAFRKSLQVYLAVYILFVIVTTPCFSVKLGCSPFFLSFSLSLDTTQLPCEAVVLPHLPVLFFESGHHPASL